MFAVNDSFVAATDIPMPNGVVGLTVDDPSDPSSDPSGDPSGDGRHAVGQRRRTQKMCIACGAPQHSDGSLPCGHDQCS